MKDRIMWGIKRVSDNKLEGYKEYFVGTLTGWELFRTREEARSYRNKHYGYIRDRPDLKVEPFCWKVPQVVKVVISIRESE